MRKAVRDRRGKSDQGESRIFAPNHTRRAGVVGFSDEGNSILPDANDARDDAETESGLVQRVALLDMRFEIADVLGRRDRLALPPRDARAFERRAQRRTVVLVASAADLVFRGVANEGAAAEKDAEMPFLVRPRRHLDRQIGASPIFTEGAGDFQPVDDAESAVEPARVVLRLAVRTDQQLSAGGCRTPEHVADPIDRRVETGVRETPREPSARLDVLGREGWPMDAGLVSAKFRQPTKVGDKAVAIDLRNRVAKPSRSVGAKRGGRGRVNRPADERRRIFPTGTPRASGKLSVNSVVRQSVRTPDFGRIANCPTRVRFSDQIQNTLEFHDYPLGVLFRENSLVTPSYGRAAPRCLNGSAINRRPRKRPADSLAIKDGFCGIKAA